MQGRDCTKDGKNRLEPGKFRPWGRGKPVPGRKRIEVPAQDGEKPARAGKIPSLRSEMHDNSVLKVGIFPAQVGVGTESVSRAKSNSGLSRNFPGSSRKKSGSSRKPEMQGRNPHPDSVLKPEAGIARTEAGNARTEFAPRFRP